MELEEEFQKLMQEVRDKICDKIASGEYDQWDGAYLLEKVDNVLDHGDTSNCGIRCPEGHSDPENCGWSPSMGYHCS